MKSMKPKWSGPLQYLALSLPRFSPSLNIPSIFWLYSFRAFAIAVPFIWSTLSSDLLGSPSTSASEKEDLLREVFHDYPIHKTSNPFPYPALFILMYFSIANIPTSYVICLYIYLFYQANVNLRARHFSLCLLW